MINLGSLGKSLTGTGIFLVISDILDHLDVVLELGGDGDDGGALGHHALDKLEDLLVLLLGRLLLDQVDLVLEDENVFQLHDLDGCKMLGGLRLGKRLIACHQIENLIIAKF